MRTLIIVAFVFSTTFAFGQTAEELYDKGHKFYSNDNYKKAIEYFTKAIEADNNYLDAYLLRGASKYHLNDLENCMFDVNKVIELDNTYSLAYILSAAVKEKLGNYNGAILDITKGIELSPEDQYRWLSTRSWLYNQNNEYENAITDAKRSIELKPEYSDSYSNLGYAYHQLGRRSEALQNYNQAIELEKWEAFTYFNRGVFHFEANNYELALLDFEQVQNLNQKEEEPYKPDETAKYLKIIEANYDDGMNWLIKPTFQYSSMSRFSEGLAVVSKNGKDGYINEKGEVVIPIIYDEAFSFEEGLAWVKKYGKFGVVDKKGNIIIPFEYDSFFLFPKKHMKFINGVIPVIKNKKYGVIDKNGNIIAPFTSQYDFDWIQPPLEHGLIRVINSITRKYGFINVRGEEIIPTVYDKILRQGNFIKVVKNEQCGILSLDGSVVLPIIYDDVDHLSNEYFRIQRNNLWSIIDRNRNSITSSTYDNVFDNIDGLFRVERNDKYGFINLNGEIVIPLKYDYARDFSEGLAIVSSNDKYGFIDKTGKVVIPLIYDHIENFQHGLARVAKDDKYGFIDKTGKVVIPLIYDWASSFAEESIFLNRNGKIGIIQNPLLKKNKPTTITQNIQLTWLSPNPDLQNGKNYDNAHLIIELRALGGNNLKKSDFKVYINNQLQTAKSGEVSLRLTTFTQKITLREGKNEILVKAGKGSSKLLTAYYSARKPTLHLLAFAPNFEENTSSQTLKYTDDDAKDIIQLFQTQKGKGIYSDVRVKSLISEDASATSITSAVERLKMQFKHKKINERDVVIVFASSHGFMENNRFYIKGDNYDPFSPTTTSVASTVMMRHLAEINCKKLLFIDACYSGGTSRDDTETRAINQTIEALTNQQKGIVTFTSSTGSQKSYEHDTWENGAFTYVITQALSGRADYNRDRKITINELNQYLQDNVPTLVRTQYNEIQTPQMFINGLDGDLPIFVY